MKKNNGLSPSDKRNIELVNIQRHGSPGLSFERLKASKIDGENQSQSPDLLAKPVNIKAHQKNVDRMNDNEGIISSQFCF